MIAKIQKWGNSLALRIPKTFADETGIGSDTTVEIWVVDGQIHIAPIREIHYELDDLLNQVNPDNVHNEIDTGDAVGNEGWQ